MTMLTFEEFLVESTIAERYDFADLANECRRAILYLQKNEIDVFNDSAHILNVSIKGKKIRVIWFHEDFGAAAGWIPSDEEDKRDGIDGEVILFTQWLAADPLEQELHIAHEFTHAIDPAPDMEVPRFLKKKSGVQHLDKEETRAWMNTSMFKDSPDLVRAARLYFGQTTEREAFVGMYVYGVQKCLSRNPEKEEQVRERLRRGKWEMDSLFPELEQVTKTIGGSVNRFGALRTKMLKRLASSMEQHIVPQKFTFTQSSFMRKIRH